MGIYRKSVLFQQGGNAMQQKTVLEDTTRENDGQPVCVQRCTLVRCHADKRCHKAQCEKMSILMLMQITCKSADHRTRIKDATSVLLIKCDGKGERLQGELYG